VEQFLITDKASEASCACEISLLGAPGSDDRSALINMPQGEERPPASGWKAMPQMMSLRKQADALPVNQSTSLVDTLAQTHYSPPHRKGS
jgi:hypothetical protein